MKNDKLQRAHRMDKVDSVVGVIFTALTFLSVAAVLYIMLNTSVNVISRAFFSRSINGSVQTSQIVLSLVALCALPVVTMYNTHIKVDLVAEKLPKFGQDVLACFNFVVCAAMMFFMSYYTFIKAGKARVQGLSMDVPAFPHWPIYDLIAIMMLVSGICAVYNLIHFLVTGTIIHPETFSEIRKRMKGIKDEKKEEDDL